MEEFLDELYTKNFAGWSGIVFLCSYDSEDSTLSAICGRATTDLELLAASHKVPLTVVKPNEFERAALLSGIQELLTLEYELSATLPDGSSAVKAVHGQLRFEAHLTDAVKKGAQPGSIYALPRTGSIELWSKTLIGVGSAKEIVVPFSDAAEGHFKKAITMYLKYAQ